MSVEGVKQAKDKVGQATLEEYRNREAESKKTHHEQIRRMRDEYEQTLKNLRDESQNKIRAYTTEAEEKLTQKDISNQSKIAEVNRLHRIQMKRNAEDHDRRMTQSKIQSQSALENLSDTKGEQIESIKGGYQDYIERQSDDFERNLVKNRDEATESVVRERGQLTEKSENDRRRLEKVRREDISAVQRELEMQRRHKESAIKQLKDQQNLSTENMRDKYNFGLEQVNKTTQEQIKMQREGFEEGLTDMREDAVRVQVKKQGEFDEGLARLREKSNEQNITQVNRLERDLARVKAEKITDTVKVKAQAKKEREALVEQFGDRQEIMTKQRQEALADSNAKNAQTIETVVRKNSKLLSDQVKNFREKMVSQEIIADEKTRELVDQIASQLKQTEASHKAQFSKERQRAEIEKRDLEERFRTIINQLRQGHSEQVLDLKSKSLREQTESINHIERALREHENKNEAKLQQVSGKYEEKIMALNSQRRNEVAKEREIGFDRLKTQERNNLMAAKTTEIQNQNQIVQLKEKYENQIDHLRKRIEKMHYEHANAPKSKG